MSRGTLAVINMDAYQHNLKVIQQKAPHSQVWAVIKADAYGHGALNAAKALDNASGFAVATVGEALKLRRSGIVKPILLLEGCISSSQLFQSVENNLTPVIHNRDQLSWLDNLSKFNPIDIWLKVDTGMHRVGFDPFEILQLIPDIKNHPLVKTVNIMSHFACADEINHPLNQLQLDRFSQFTRLNLACSFANSAAIWQFPESHHQWTRPGISLYGASPFADQSAESLGLKPVMTLKSRVIAERTISEGETVGYGARWSARKSSKIATIAIGYGDGYPRHAPDGTPVWINGQEVPLAGKVSMDMLTIDVSDVSGSVLDQEVELWGENLPVDRVASHIGTIGYELLTRVSPRVRRI